MKCFDKNNKHVGKLETLFRVDISWDNSAEINWCPECGAVVVDKLYDNRRVDCYVKMQFSKLISKKLKEVN